MKAWNNYWHGPVAAVRPYLLVKGVLILLALDVWHLRIAGGAVFYDDRFHAAHFRFLDWLLPVPPPPLYVGVVLLTGLLSLVSALVGVNRFALATLFVLYTTAWSMTRLDLYQHHYLLSLVLLCLVFFPKIRAADWHTVTTDGRTGFDLIRQTAHVRTSAWAFAMLGVSVAIVYTYTAIAKLDSLWLAGHTLQTIDKSRMLPRLFGKIFTLFGRPTSDVWAFMATGAIFVELAIAAGYLTTIRQDRRSSLPLRLGCLVLWLAAMLLHLGFEALQLQIGWFSYYMMLAACVYFLPATWLCVPGALVIWPGCRLIALMSRWDDQVAGSGRRWILIGMAGMVIVIVMLIAKAINLPGALGASIVTGAGLLILAVFGPRSGSSAPTRRVILATGIAAVVMWATIAHSAEQFEFYGIRAVDLERRNRPGEAIDAKRTAEHYAPEDGPRRAKFHTSFGDLLDAQRQFNAAIGQYRKALHFQPDHVVADVKLGLTLASAGRIDEAVDHLRELVHDRPDSAPSLNALAWILATHTDNDVADPAQAVQLARRASELTGYKDPVILDTLAAAYAAAGRFDEAVSMAQKALDLARADFPEETIRELSERLDLFRQAKPYRKSMVAP